MPSRATVYPGAKFQGQWIYTAQLFGHDVQIYKQNGNVLNFDETLTQGVGDPQGTKATPSGWWYVSNGSHSNVLVYRSTSTGPTGPVNTLDDTGQYPANVDVTPNRKLVAVSNASTYPSTSGSGSVSVYVDRSAVPSRMLTYGQDRLLGIGIAIDHQGNCYWSFNDETSGGGSIVVFAGCAANGTLLVGGIPFAGGLTFNQSGDLYYIDQTTGIYKCVKTSRCQLFSTGFGDPVNINFDLKDKLLWVADATGYIDAVDPKTGAIVSSTASEGGSSDPPFGIAAAPGGK